jgi:spore coat protein U-like protein
MTSARARASLIVACAWLLASAGHCWAAGSSLAVSATIVSKSNCKFSIGTAPAVTVKNNGTAIDPSLTVNATGTATATFTCNGSANVATYTVTAGDGTYPAGPGLRRMRHATVTTEFLPYSLTISPSSGSVNKGSPATVTMTATVLSANYQAALAGSYSDTVAVTVSP